MKTSNFDSCDPSGRIGNEGGETRGEKQQREFEIPSSVLETGTEHWVGQRQRRWLRPLAQSCPGL
ncbi:hypothetical protein EYF80_011667 [Liparis tanakae]|uniref:Uncharacterized protein n=1 Tax=Liparis tanakae TaxID=230148 RepID=A0A4Z2ILT9_9TELE|nr:hypothetical protein EYF80_011667 [Liparis tanakae]